MRSDNGPFDIQPRDITYDATTDTYQVTYDPCQGFRPSSVVVGFLATLLDVTVDSLPALTEQIDAHAVDMLLQGARAQAADLEVKFTYLNHRIMVSAMGEIQARPV